MTFSLTTTREPTTVESEEFDYKNFTNQHGRDDVQTLHFLPHPSEFIQSDTDEPPMHDSGVSLTDSEQKPIMTTTTSHENEQTPKKTRSTQKLNSILKKSASREETKSCWSSTSEVAGIKVKQQLRSLHMLLINLTLKLSDRRHPPAALISASKYLAPHAYEELLQERTSNCLCAWTLCGQQVQPVGSGNSGPRYRISLEKREVYELDLNVRYCSRRCWRWSDAYKALLSPEPLETRDLEHWETTEVELLLLGQRAEKRDEVGEIERRLRELRMVSGQVERVLEKETRIIERKNVEDMHKMDVSDHTLVEGYQPGSKFRTSNQIARSRSSKHVHFLVPSDSEED